MRKLLIAAAFLTSSLFNIARSQSIDRLDVLATLHRDGSATIVQTWDVTPSPDNTEWYYAIDNLGKMEVSGLEVSENGRMFISEGRNWDIHRTIDEKAGRCGIVEKSGGVELCWGIGTAEPHTWTVRFELSGLVQSLQDYDAFNHQFINRDLRPHPAHTKVVIDNDSGLSFTPDNTGIWGFGNDGTINFADGKIVALADYIRDGGSVTVMCRFEKGMFSPSVSRDIPFSDMRDKAFKHSGYEDDGFPAIMAVFMGIFFLGLLFLFIWPLVELIFGRKYAKIMFGQRKITGWFREAPLQKNLLAAAYVDKHGLRFGGSIPCSNLIGAFFLRWIMDGVVKVQKDPKNEKRVNLAFLADPENPEGTAVQEMGVSEKKLYGFARQAAADNALLEKNEFRKWSENNAELMAGWPSAADYEGFGWLIDNKYLKGNKTAVKGMEGELKKVIEFKNFLKDFTMSKEREAIEVGMWKDYLVYAQLFGIADKVAKQFKTLYPAEFEQLSNELGMNSNDMLWYVTYNNTMSSKAIIGAQSKMSATEIAGGGGGMSFGGGGGFSGGGGGGGR